MIIKTGIAADQPTDKGTVYPLEVLEKMVLECNVNLSRDKNQGRPIRGGWFSEMYVGTPSKHHEPQHKFFELKGLKLEGGELLAEVEFTDKKQQVLIEEQKDSEVMAKLVIELPLDQSVGTMIKEIRRVHSVALTWSKGGPSLIKD